MESGRCDATLSYDGTCRLCTGSASRLERLLGRLGVEVTALPDGGEADEMTLRLADGRVVGGADVVFELAGRVWWGWPLSIVGKAPGVRWLARKGYRVLARNRHRWR